VDSGLHAAGTRFFVLNRREVDGFLVASRKEGSSVLVVSRKERRTRCDVHW
jgi:hypothetical protein